MASSATGAASTARRLLPSGPLRRLSSRNLNASSTVDGEWQRGRAFDDEEHRSGMLTSVRTAMLEGGAAGVAASRRRGGNSSNGSNNALVLNANRFSGVVRCQATDWQANELDMYGDVVALNSRPKGKWDKVDKHKTILVEDNSDESFSDPNKTYSPRIATGGKYAMKLGVQPKGTPILNFNVYREHHSMPTVLERMRYTTRISSEAVAFSGDEGCGGLSSMDGFGTITQQGKALGVTKDLLPHASQHYGIHPLIFDPRGYEAMPSKRSESTLVFKTDSQGALYRTVVRCSTLDGPSSSSADDVQKKDSFYGSSTNGTSSPSSASNSPSLAELAAGIQKQGFLNYYPLSTFSVATNPFHAIAAAVGKGNYYKACSSFLQSYAESNPIFFDDYARYVAADDGTAPSIMLTLADTIERTRGHHNLVHFMRDLTNVKDFSNGSAELQSIWERWVYQKSKYTHSAVAYVWNAMASQRVLSAGVGRVLVGDVVFVTEAEFDALLNSTKDTHRLKQLYSPATVEGIFATSSQRFYVTRVRTQEQADNFEMSRVVMPVCDHRNPQQLIFPKSYGTYEVHHALAKQQGLDWITDPAKRPLFEQMTRGSRIKTSPHNLPLYRTIVAYPSHVEVHSLNDPNSVAALKTDLFLMQERQQLYPSLLPPPSNGYDGKSYVPRIRDPSPFNVSPAFREQMAPIIANAQRLAASGGDSKEEIGGSAEADNTTFIAARLPRNSHMSCFLREHFHLKYGRFHDMLW